MDELVLVVLVSKSKRESVIDFLTQVEKMTEEARITVYPVPENIFSTSSALKEALKPMEIDDGAMLFTPESDVLGYTQILAQLGTIKKAFSTISDAPSVLMPGTKPRIRTEEPEETIGEERLDKAMIERRKAEFMKGYQMAETKGEPPRDAGADTRVPAPQTMPKKTVVKRPMSFSTGLGRKYPALMAPTIDDDDAHMRNMLRDKTRSNIHI